MYSKHLPHGGFPGSLVVKISPASAQIVGLISGQRAKIPQNSQKKRQNIKQKWYFNNFNKNLKKMVHIQKINNKKEKKS